MKRIGVRIVNYKTKYVTARRKFFYNENDCTECIKASLGKLKENECVRITFFNDKYYMAYACLYADSEIEDIKLANLRINEWFADN